MANAALAILLSARDTATPVLKGAKEQLGGWKAAAAVAGAAAAGMAGLMADLTREGQADAAALEAVKIAVQNTGAAWTDASGPLDAYMLKMRDTAAVDDGLLKPALAGLIAVTGDYEKAMSLASLAADLAKGKDMSLATASELVGKVAEGNVSILKRYGITLDENATSQEALAELQKRFAGQAEAYATTSKGKLEILKLKLGDFREEIGQSIDGLSPYVALLPGLSAAYTGVGGAVGVVTKAYGANTLASIAHKVATVAAKVATAAMTAVQWLLNAALNANPIGLVVLAVAALAAAVIWAYKNVDWFRAIVDKAFSLLKTAVKAAVDAAGGAIGWLGDRIGDIIGKLRDLIDLLGKIPGVQGALNLLGLGDSIRGFAEGGIVPGPIGSPRLAIVHGGERISPAGSAGAGGGGGTQVNVTVYGWVGSDQQIAARLRDELLFLKGSNVSVGLA